MDMRVLSVLWEIEGADLLSQTESHVFTFTPRVSRGAQLWVVLAEHLAQVLSVLPPGRQVKPGATFWEHACQLSFLPDASVQALGPSLTLARGALESASCLVFLSGHSPLRTGRGPGQVLLRCLARLSRSARSSSAGKGTGRSDGSAWRSRGSGTQGGHPGSPGPSSRLTPRGMALWLRILVAAHPCGLECCHRASRVMSRSAGGGFVASLLPGAGCAPAGLWLRPSVRLLGWGGLSLSGGLSAAFCSS